MVKSQRVKTYNNPKKKWQNDFKIITFTFPRQMNHQYYKNRSHMIIIFYTNKNGQIKNKKIFFGFKNGKTKIIDKKYITKRKKTDNPFHPAYWQNRLLQNKQTLLQSYIDLIKQLKLTNQMENQIKK